MSHPGRRYVDELGLDRTWNPEDRDYCLEHHRYYYRRLKKAYGGINTSVSDIPGFVEAVRLAVQDGFSLTDVGVMFGVSRERVRQWCKQYDIEQGDHHSSQYRIWSDDESRFVPVSQERMYELAYKYHQDRVNKEREDRLNEHRSAHVEAMKKLAKRFGRTPTLSELEDEVGESWPNIARDWGYDAQDTSEEAGYAAAYRRLCDAANVPRREPGGGGHVT